MATQTTYHVFRRSPDGYVNAIAGDAERLAGRQGTINGERVTFEVLLSTQDWALARDRIAQERTATPHPQPKEA